MLRTAITGLGVISGAHISALKACKDVEIVALCDIDKSKRDLMPDIAFYEDYEEMCDVENLDTVHICLPHHLHTSMTLLAARKGISVFLEKPAGLNTEDLMTLDGVESTYDVKVGVCLQNRLNATTKKALSFIENGTYGRLIGMKAILAWDRESDYYTRDPWRGKISEAGSGLLMSQAIHTIDLMILFAGPVVSVRGTTSNLYHDAIEVEDTASACMIHSNGVRSIFFGTVAHCRDASVEIELVFENKVLYLDDEILYTSCGIEREILAENEKVHNGKRYYGAGHTLAIRQFYEAFSGLHSEYITLEDAKESIRVIDSIIKSETQYNSKKH